VAKPELSFAGLLRQLRTEAKLTQEELAEATGLSPRSISDLERGLTRTAHKDTGALLAGALSLSGVARELFVAAARGKALAAEVLAARQGAGPGAFAAAATRALPRDIAAFTGRQAELAQLMAALATADGGVVRIHAVDGMAGTGKTTFAVHAAHRLARSFPDGQFFLPLHAHTPGQRPVDPADALASLLLTAGATAAHIPPGLDDRAGRWRDHMAGKKILLLLDDAASHEQIRPLLPGTAGSSVLVTSRRRLTALDASTVISLGTLPRAEAATLLVRLAARSGLRADDVAVGELTRLCGYLPLAIGMLASQLRHHPAWTARQVAADLTAAKDRLALMQAENVSVAAAFDLSYADLTPGSQQLFRRLGLVPGPSFDSSAATALAGTGLDAARRCLSELYDQHLIGEPTPGRYQLHDLLREHARALAGRLDPDSDRDGVITRLLDYYQYTAARAAALIASRTDPALAPPDGARPAAVPDLDGREAALAWARAERASLLACLDHAARTGQHARVVALTVGLAGLLELDGPWAEAITRHTAAIQAARHLGDRLGQARALTHLGVVRWLTGEYLAAAQAHEQALGIYRDLGDRVGQAHAFIAVGVARLRTGEYPAAAQALDQALGTYHDLGDRSGQADVLGYLGEVRRAAGEYPAAAQALDQALGIYRDLGWREGEAQALTHLGVVRWRTGEHRAAAQALDQALGTYRDLGNRLGEAHVLMHLGEVRRAAGEYPAAAQALDQALGIYRDRGWRLGEAEALNERGTLHRASGDFAQAEGCHRQALDLARAIDSSWVEAHALAGLGRCALAADHADEAEDSLRQALEIFRRIGAAEAAEVSAELEAFNDARSASGKCMLRPGQAGSQKAAHRRSVTGEE
jgi:tetratricopeptide (TPR) repeat protein/transcriptional regulator with XRE-family HTH domain